MKLFISSLHKRLTKQLYGHNTKKNMEKKYKIRVVLTNLMILSIKTRIILLVL